MAPKTFYLPAQKRFTLSTQPSAVDPTRGSARQRISSIKAYENSDRGFFRQVFFFSPAIFPRVGAKRSRKAGTLMMNAVKWFLDDVKGATIAPSNSLSTIAPGLPFSTRVGPSFPTCSMYLRQLCKLGRQDCRREIHPEGTGTIYLPIPGKAKAETKSFRLPTEGGRDHHAAETAGTRQ